MFMCCADFVFDQVRYAAVNLQWLLQRTPYVALAIIVTWRVTYLFQQFSAPSPSPIVAINTTPAPALFRHFYVAPTGRDADDGRNETQPFKTIQRALASVGPGDTIHLAPGEYTEALQTLADGTSAAPITITGPPTAILRGVQDTNTILQIAHNYYVLEGFTLDGLHGDPAQVASYTDKLLYTMGRSPGLGVQGLRVSKLTFQNAGGECLRLRYFAQHNEIAHSTFSHCGVFDFKFNHGGKNGEAIYVGTSSNQWADGKNPTADPDASDHNWIHHNTMNTQGNECVDVKEGASANLIEYNTCTGQRDPNSAGFDSRGNANIIRYNIAYGNLGAGVRVGGHKVAGTQYGKANEVYGNQLYDNAGGAVSIMINGQKKICGNDLSKNQGRVTAGDYGNDYDPAAPCAE
jgi:hypothetical protein